MLLISIKTKTSNILQNRKMSEHQNKIIKIYKLKNYDMNVGSFLNFIQEKVNLDSFGVDLIRQKIEEFNIDETFNQQTFRLLLRLIATVQKSGNKTKYLSQQDIMKTNATVQFKTSKKNKQKQSQYQYENGNGKVQKNHQNYKENNSYNTQEQQAEQRKLKNQLQSRNQQNMKKNITLQQIKLQQPKSQRKQQQKNYESSPKQITKKQKVESQIQNTNKNKVNKNQTNKKVEQPQQKSTSTPFNGLKTIQQVQNSTQINFTQNQKQKPVPRFLDMTQNYNQKKEIIEKAKITQYEKFSTDYVNTVFKFKIEYAGKNVLRRFSEFQKLINILRQKYQGFILPQLPPKQGIKAGMTYFWGVDQVFLEERRKKLQQFVNRLLQTKFINQEEILQWFLTDQNYQIQYVGQTYGAYLKTFTDIVFNAKQLKDYGVAYCNYLRQKGNVKLNAEIQKKYQEIQKIIQIFMSLNDYRKRINVNFQKRRQILYDLNIRSKKPQNPDFDKMMDLIEEQIKNLTSQIEKYKRIKSQQSWIHELIRQKQTDGPKKIHDLNEEQQKLQTRIKKMEQNLMMSLRDFKQSKTKKLEDINSKILGWRQNVHP